MKLSNAIATVMKKRRILRMTVLPRDKAFEESLKQARMLCLSRSCFVDDGSKAGLIKYFAHSLSLAYLPLSLSLSLSSKFLFLCLSPNSLFLLSVC